MRATLRQAAKLYYLNLICVWYSTKGWMAIRPDDKVSHEARYTPRLPRHDRKLFLWQQDCCSFYFEERHQPRRMFIMSSILHW